MEAHWGRSESSKGLEPFSVRQGAAKPAIGEPVLAQAKRAGGRGRRRAGPGGGGEQAVGPPSRLKVLFPGSKSVQRIEEPHVKNVPVAL